MTHTTDGHLQSKRHTFVWCTYRDWSFQVLEGLLNLVGWQCVLMITTENCRYAFERLQQLGIPVLRVNPQEAFKENGAAFERVQQLQPQVMFYYGWSWKVPACTLRLCLNLTLHPGKLPKDRGGSPLQNQIRNGETWTYVNLIELVDALDAGDIWWREKISLAGDSVDDVWARMVVTGTWITRQFLQGFAQQNLVPISQATDIQPTVYKRVSDARLMPETQTALQLYNLIRAHNETDANRYVTCAWLPLDGYRIWVERASLQMAPLLNAALQSPMLEPADEQPRLKQIYNLMALDQQNDQYADHLFELAHRCHNGQACVFLLAADGLPVYLQRWRIVCDSAIK